jgi:hypothetical protein
VLDIKLDTITRDIALNGLLEESNLPIRLPLLTDLTKQLSKLLAKLLAKLRKGPTRSFRAIEHMLGTINTLVLRPSIPSLAPLG